MKSKKIIYTIFKTCLGFIVLVIIIALVYKFCGKSYDFGYRIFAEEPLSPPPGITMTVAIVEGKSAMDIGKILEEKGLIRDAYLFYLQEKVSNYHGQLKPGVYELSTAMTPDEMIAIMAADTENVAIDDTDLESSSSSESDENTNISEEYTGPSEITDDEGEGYSDETMDEDFE